MVSQGEQQRSTHIVDKTFILFVNPLNAHNFWELVSWGCAPLYGAVCVDAQLHCVGCQMMVHCTENWTLVKPSLGNLVGKRQKSSLFYTELHQSAGLPLAKNRTVVRISGLQFTKNRAVMSISGFVKVGIDI